MAFKELFKTNTEKIKKPITQNINEAKNNNAEVPPEDLLRANGLKIKLVTPTAFGIQVDFFKKYDEELVKNILKDYNIKLKNKSIFIVN